MSDFFNKKRKQKFKWHFHKLNEKRKTRLFDSFENTMLVINTFKRPISYMADQSSRDVSFLQEMPLRAKDRF